MTLNAVDPGLRLSFRTAHSGKAVFEWGKYPRFLRLRGRSRERQAGQADGAVCLAGEVFGEERIFPPKPGAKSGRQRVDRSFKSALKTAGIENFRFHDLRHTFASWYMMNGGDLYELAKILGHAHIKMTERYAKPAKQHIARTGNTAREMWRMMEKREGESSERAG